MLIVHQRIRALSSFRRPLNPFTATACQISWLKSEHIHASKQYVICSCNKSTFSTVHFDRNPFTCSWEVGKTASNLALLLVVLGKHDSGRVKRGVSTKKKKNKKNKTNKKRGRRRGKLKKKKQRLQFLTVSIWSPSKVVSWRSKNHHQRRRKTTAVRKSPATTN